MSLVVLFLLLIVVLAYWFLTQIMPEREKDSLLRPTLSEAFLESVNNLRHRRGLPILEMDDVLCGVAESKAVHEIMTGRSDEGWDYPEEYDDLLGRSLLMESLVIGEVTTIPERLARYRDLFDGEWITCGIGVAGGKSDHVVVALILCREAWEPAMEVARMDTRSRLERFVMGR